MILHKAAHSSPKDPDVEYDRGYADGMQQVLREVWPHIRGERGDDRWWDALADYLKKLDARAAVRVQEARAAAKANS